LPREDPQRGFRSFPALDPGDKVRERSETFSDHYSQARLFWRSMSDPEKLHIVKAYVFELSKVSTIAVRKRVLGHLANIDRELLQRVEAGLGMTGQADSIAPARQPFDMKPSPALSLIKKAPKTLKGRKVGVLVTDGSDPAVVAALKSALAGVGARMEVVAPKIGGAKGQGGKLIPADHKIDGGPSIFFDAVVVAASVEGAAMLANDPATIDWIRDAFAHLKVMGVTESAESLLKGAGIAPDDGVITIKGKGVGGFVESAMGGRVWKREPAE